MANPKHLKILRKGIAKWNSMREQSPSVIPDLSGADLRGALLIGPKLINLAGTNLRGADLCRANLAGLLRGADLTGADLREANLGVDFCGANLTGADLSGANLSGMDLNSANLTGAKLTGAKLNAANLSNVNLTAADLRLADLTGANLSGKANLSNANFAEANLRLADLTEANLSGANLRNANLTGAKVRLADLSKADLIGTNLRLADLTEANLRLVDLTEADLGEANLSNANLTGANLWLADVTRSDLTGADLTKANLLDTKGHQNRTLKAITDKKEFYVPSGVETESSAGRHTSIAIERILCPVDFSEASVVAYRYAQSIACRYRARLILQHVVEFWRHQSCYCQVETLISNTRDQLRQFADKYGGVQPECVVEESAAADESILSLARTRAVSLIVMGTHGCRGFDHLVLGSVTERVLRHAPCPVLAIHEQRPDESANSPAADPVQVRQILCCVDFSAYSQRALDHALSVAEAYGAEVTVLHVLDNISAESPDVEKETNATLGKLRKLIAPSAAVSTKIHMDVRLGEAYREILRFAAERRSDLIVTGVRGRNSLDLGVFGSTTYRLIQHYPGSVLTVPI